MMPLPSFRSLYLCFPIVLGLHNLDECTQAERLLYSRHFRRNVTRTAMIVLTIASVIAAILNCTVRTDALLTITELSVFSLLFNAVGPVLVSRRRRAWTPGARSAALLVLPYSIITLAAMARDSGRTVLTLWPLR